MSYFDLKKYLAEGGLEAKLSEVEEVKEGMSDNDFIMALNKAFAAADAIMEEGVEEGMDPDEDDDSITPPGIEDMSPDPMFGSNPSFVEEDIDEGRGRKPGSGREREVNFKIFTGDKSKENILKLLKKFNKLYVDKRNPTIDPKSKRPRKPFSDEALENLAELFSTKEKITSKDIIEAVPRYNSPSQANAFLKVMDELGRSEITSVDKKVQDLQAKEKRDSGETPETRGRKKKVADDEFEGGSIEGPSDDELADIEKELGLEENTKFLNRILKSPLKG